ASPPETDKKRVRRRALDAWRWACMSTRHEDGIREEKRCLCMEKEDYSMAKKQ
ncbi:hypothetical protein COCCADRAFT_105001, partial [Bipolaris zeicola 26-R-13]